MSLGKLRLVVALLAGVMLTITQARVRPTTDRQRFQSFLEELSLDENLLQERLMDDQELQGKVLEFFKTLKPQKEQLFSARDSVSQRKKVADTPLVEFDTPQIIHYYGYPTETHYVTTEDGYNLELHRIPFGKDGHTPGEIREPIIIQHGLLSSSADWVMNPPHQSLAFLLADAGYDVWLSNARGNTYSHTNNHMSSKDRQFWLFSWNKMGDYDMPAVIDYVLYRTGYPQVYYAGHSMGTTMFFVLMDKHPEYNEKVKAFFAMAPVAKIDNMKSPVKVLVPFVDLVEWFLDFIHMYEFMPSSNFMKFFATFFCDDDDFTQFLCSNIMFMLSGYNKKQLNTTMLSTYMAHTPAGSSAKAMVHYGQIADSTIFRHYDHGKDNIDFYGNTAPPLYDLTKTTVNAYFYWGQNDWLATPTDVMAVAEIIPNLKLTYRVEDDDWTHLDFMWAIQANTMVYQKIIDEMSTMHIDLNK